MESEVIIRAPNFQSPAEAQEMKDAFFSTGFFYDFEIDVVNEMIDEGSSYTDMKFLVAEVQDKVVGVSIYGPDSMSRTAWVLYWICVHKDHRDKGIGKKLMQYTESDISKTREINILYIETSGRDLYSPTRQFYADLGYKCEAILDNYYAVGDAKYIYSKVIK